MPTRTCEKAGGGEKGREGKGRGRRRVRVICVTTRGAARISRRPPASLSGALLAECWAESGSRPFPPPPSPQPLTFSVTYPFSFYYLPLSGVFRSLRSSKPDLARGTLPLFRISFSSTTVNRVPSFFFFFSFFSHVFFPTRLFLGELVLGGNFWKRYLRYKRGEEEGFIIPLSRFDNSLSSLPNPWNERNRTWREQGK